MIIALAISNAILLACSVFLLYGWADARKVIARLNDKVLATQIDRDMALGKVSAMSAQRRAEVRIDQTDPLAAPKVIAHQLRRLGGLL